MENNNTTRLPSFQDVFNIQPTKTNKAFESIIDRPSCNMSDADPRTLPYYPAAMHKANELFTRDPIISSPSDNNAVISSGSSMEEIQSIADRLSHKRRFEMVDQQIRTNCAGCMAKEKLVVQYSCDDQETTIPVRGNQPTTHTRAYSL